MKAEAQPEVKPEQVVESVEVCESSKDQTLENKEVTHWLIPILNPLNIDASDFLAFWSFSIGKNWGTE